MSENRINSCSLGPDEVGRIGMFGASVVGDLSPEEDDGFCKPAANAGLGFTHLAGPTTDDAPLPTVLANTSGFVYDISVTGVTGTKTASVDPVAAAVDRLKRHTELPIGFGVKAADIARVVADGAVIGSKFLDTFVNTLDDKGRATKETVQG